MFSTGQGAQFSSEDFTGVLKRHGVEIRKDGNGRWLDNVVAQRFWRSVKYANVYLHTYQTPGALRVGMAQYFEFYNARRRRGAQHRRTPDAV